MRRRRPRRRPAASCRRYNQSGSPIFVDAELLAFVLHKETVRESGLVGDPVLLDHVPGQRCAEHVHDADAS